MIDASLGTDHELDHDRDELDDVWKALASSTRRQILDLLVDGPVTTGSVVAEFPDLSRFAVMQHLRVLEKADLVIARKSGRQRFNHLNAVPIQRISDRWISRYHRPLAEAMVDLKLSIESQVTAEIAAGNTTATPNRNTIRDTNRDTKEASA